MNDRRIENGVRRLGRDMDPPPGWERSVEARAESDRLERAALWWLVILVAATALMFGWALLEAIDLWGWL